MLNELRKLQGGERGMGGLEMAIILLAFVVVSSGLAYAIISAGTSSAERSEEVVYAGLKQARNTLEPKGSVIAYSGAVNGTNAVTKIAFTVSKAATGDAVDLTPPYKVLASTGALADSGLDHTTVISYSDRKQFISDAAWTVEFVGKSNGDYLLEEDERAVITVWLANYDGSAYSLGGGEADPFFDRVADLLTTRQEFTLEVKPPQGAVLTFERTTPSGLASVMYLK
jgi:flagellin FlaB